MTDFFIYTSLPLEDTNARLLLSALKQKNHNQTQSLALILSLRVHVRASVFTMITFYNISHSDFTLIYEVCEEGYVGCHCMLDDKSSIIV